MILKLLRLTRDVAVFARDRCDDWAEWADMWGDILDPTYLDRVLKD